MNYEQRLNFFDRVCQQKLPAELSQMLEDMDYLSVLKSECASIINTLTRNYVKTKSQEDKLLLTIAKMTYTNMGSRLRVMTTLISAEKALLALNPQNVSE